MKKETEVKKDIEWLKGKINAFQEGENMFTAEFNAGVQDALEYVQELTDQLDEPEVLSQEWIDEHKVARINNLRKMTMSDVVPVDKLQNLLLPKQEITEEQAKDVLREKSYTIARMYDDDNKTVLPFDFYRQVLISHGYIIIEKPTIPQFVADWIEGNKQFEEKWNDYSKEDAMNDTIHFTIYGLFADYPATNSHVELRKPVLKWLSVDRGNYFKLVNAVRYGYEVEEQKYYVLSKELHPMLCESAGTDKKIMESTTQLTINEKGLYKEQYALTEQEIKDYDERYWAFAVKVEEMEE